MKKILSSLLCSCTLLLQLAATATATASEMQLPDVIQVKQHWFSTTIGFTVTADSTKLGTVHRKFWSFLPTYEFVNCDNSLQATAKMDFFSWGPRFTVKDSSERVLGTVEERLFTFFPTFDIVSPSGEKLVHAKMNFWGTKFTLTDPATNQILAYLKRPFFRMKDDWTANILHQESFVKNKIDPRLFITLVAFQSDKDCWKRSKNAKSLSNLPKLDIDVTPYMAMLDEVAPIVEGVTPTEADIEFVAHLLEAHLETIDFNEGSSIEGILKDGLNRVMPLFYSDTLTQGQKAALYMILQQFLLTLA